MWIHTKSAVIGCVIIRPVEPDNIDSIFAKTPPQSLMESITDQRGT
jgi:hypothetical protein